jgi:hypothetical protein
VIVWLALAVLVAAIVTLEYRDRRDRGPGAGGARDARALVPVPVEHLAAVEIADRGRLHRFERDAAGAWFYHGVHTAATGDHTHATDRALAERIAHALAAFARARTEREFPLDGDGAAYGVAAPEVVILLYEPRRAQPLAQYAVGGLAPDTLSRYVVVVGSRRVVTIPGYQIDNLLALVDAAAGADPPLAGGR